MSAVGVKSIWAWRVLFPSILLVIYVALTSCTPARVVVAAPEAPQITIRIPNLDPKVKMGVARVIGTDKVTSLDQGKFVLEDCKPGQSISVWVAGYYIRSFPCLEKPSHEYSIELEPINPTDNPNYAWISADTQFNAVLGCARCHSDPSGLLNEYSEWNVDGHSKALISPYFWTTYTGTNINRALSQETLWGFSPSGTRFRLPPDSSKANFGPGYQLDYPNGSGNCAFCHAPAAIGATQQEANLTSWISGSWGNRVNVVTEGVTCDVCHKVIGVSLDQNKLPYLDRPGILSFSFLRPTSGSQFVAGPWSQLTTSMTDIKRTCVSIFSDSSFCAPCHYAKFSGVEIYGSYKEWLDSPYSQPNQGYRSCQDCHMQSSQSVDGTVAAARSACSPENHSFNNFSHNMLNRDNTGSPVMIERAATVTVDARKEEGKIKVDVAVVNTRAGHKLPTDSPLRHLILVIEVRDENNMPLTQVEGPIIPEWGGTGNQPEDYAGQPGVIYANLLKDKDTNMVPAVSYWNPTIPAWEGSDTRLLPNQYVLSQYSFVTQSHGDVTITAKLFYRYAFIDIMRQKGLQSRDVLVNWDDHTVSE